MAHFLKELHINVRNHMVSRGMILLFLFFHLEPGDRYYWHLETCIAEMPETNIIETQKQTGR